MGTMLIPKHTFSYLGMWSGLTIISIYTFNQDWGAGAGAGAGRSRVFLAPWSQIRSRSRLKKTGVGAGAGAGSLFYIFYCFTLLVYGEKNVLPNLTNSQEPEPVFLAPWSRSWNRSR